MSLPRLLRYFTLAATIIASFIQAGCRPAGEQADRAPQVPQVAVKDLRMERYNIARPDSMQWIFNGRGKCYPRRFSLTGFNGLNQISGAWEYRFRFDFVEKRSGVRIMDNVPEVMETNDPCGWNFRAGAPFCIVPQDDTWYPHAERRTGSFHKNFKTCTVSFWIATRTMVSARTNEVLLTIEIENRDTAPLTLTLLPMQNGQNTFEHRDGQVSDCLVTDLTTAGGKASSGQFLPRPNRIITSPSDCLARGSSGRAFANQTLPNVLSRPTKTAKPRSGGLPVLCHRFKPRIGNSTYFTSDVSRAWRCAAGTGRTS